MSFRRLLLGRRRRWSLVVETAPGRSYELARLPFDVVPWTAAPAVMSEAAPPLRELVLRARRLEAGLQLVGDAAGGPLIADLHAVRGVGAHAGSALRSALEAHGRDVGYSTRVWHRRATHLTETLVEDCVGTIPAEIAAVASLRLSLALDAARRDPMAVPGHLVAAAGRVDALGALAFALLPDRHCE